MSATETADLTRSPLSNVVHVAIHARIVAPTEAKHGRLRPNVTLQTPVLLAGPLPPGRVQLVFTIVALVVTAQTTSMSSHVKGSVQKWLSISRHSTSLLFCGSDVYTVS